MDKEKELLRRIEELESEIDNIHMHMSDASYEIGQLIEITDNPWLISKLKKIKIILSGQIPVEYYG